MKTLIIFLLTLCILCNTSFSQSAGKKEVKVDRKQIQKVGNNFDWKAYDQTSKISIDSIKPESLQGLWKAYNGLFRFGDIINSMNLTQPFIVEINGDKIRRNTNSTFEPFSLTKNEIISDNGKDKGFINKITETLLIITWENGSNYTRYYYEK